MYDPDEDSEYEFDVDDLPTDDDTPEPTGSQAHDHDHEHRSPTMRDWAMFFAMAAVTLLISAAPAFVYYFIGFEESLILVGVMVWATCLQILF